MHLFSPFVRLIDYLVCSNFRKLLHNVFVQSINQWSELQSDRFKRLKQGKAENLFHICEAGTIKRIVFSHCLHKCLLEDTIHSFLFRPSVPDCPSAGGGDPAVGITWSPTSFIVDDVGNPDGLNLGSVVVDEVARKVILIYSLCFHLFHCSPASTMLVESRDDGLSWSAPRNLSVQLGVKNFAPGPGYGIQKRYNPGIERLVVCGHGTIEGDGVFCILSDDHGQNWRNGAALKSIPYNQEKRQNDFNPDECQPVEMPDGSILINVRNQYNYHCRCRIVTRSYDGGMTLPIDHLFFDYELVDPVVAAGALQKDGLLYFTNPSNEQHRVNLTLRWSLTSGKSWESKALQIWPGASGYSSMTSLDTSSVEDQKHIYIIYEKGNKDIDETISFAKIHLRGTVVSEQFKQCCYVNIVSSHQFPMHFTEKNMVSSMEPSYGVSLGLHEEPEDTGGEDFSEMLKTTYLLRTMKSHAYEN
ncbi:hypothetical protein F2P81_023152 [Scophthalmus maximus]|uniref:Sialidase-1 n=1 Tax=Scophthalmus maximus TaxID=52904 RepID=A0A6A4RYE6_SCOMX|nr:hypothetical protein F2P81_023152 [Scophthalmus maximus]